MGNVKLHDFLTRESGHLYAQFIGDKFDQAVEFLAITHTLELLELDELDGKFWEDNLADVEVDSDVDEGSFWLKKVSVTWFLADGVEHAYELLDELLAVELLGGHGNRLD